jgi:hypothetical protein
MNDKEPRKTGADTGSCGCLSGDCCPAASGPEGDSTDMLPGERGSRGAGCSCNTQESKLETGIDTNIRPDAPVAPVITQVTGTLDAKNTLDHLLARLGQNRAGHRVPPGLYALGRPGPESPVVVTANYTLSFDAVRSAMAGQDAYVLVLDTKGVNVWCAAGKGTFGTEELINRIRNTGLSSVVHHHRVILPQLGAPGVAAHEVHKATGFHVEYGPVRASDLPEFLRDRTATPEMRRVTFDLRDRVVLIPVELRGVALVTIIAAVALWFTGGVLPVSVFIAAVLAGTVLFPVLLPYLPTADFSIKGMVLGIIIAIPFASLVVLTGVSGIPLWVSITEIVAVVSILPAITAYLALNFTGCTPYTSRTGVKREIYRYIPFMAGLVIVGTVCAVLPGFTKLLGMW